MLLATLAPGPFVPVAIAQTPAGTDVVNTAGASYDAASVAENSGSNSVATRVLQFYALDLNPPGTVPSPAFMLSGAAGDTLYGAFTIDNLGNGRDSMQVASAQVPPSTITTGAVIFFQDANGNGGVDPGEDDPAFLAANMGATITMDVAVVLPPGTLPGDAFIQVDASSVNDPAGAFDTCIFQVVCTGAQSGAVHFGPRGNPRAQPGGDGSADDISTGVLGYSDYQYTFENELLNESTAASVFEVFLADTTGLPADVAISFADSAGAPLPPASLPNGALLGSVGAGETGRIQVIASSALRPLYQNIGSGLDLQMEARSVSDTTAVDQTLDRLLPPAPVNPGAALVLQQAFREPRVSAGDVATLVVTVTNITDSLSVGGIMVAEAPEPVLDFSSSPDFRYVDGHLEWDVGLLAGGETRSSVVKFVANSRVQHGNARVTGNAAGTAASGQQVNAAPVQSLVRVDNDLFAAEGIILGDVFVDLNKNDVRDPGEPGVPGATVYLESGDYAIADTSGAFSLPRVFAGWRVARLDESTIPADVVFADPLSGPYDGRRGNERLVRLLPGGHVRVQFPLHQVPPATIEVPQSVALQEKVSIHKQARLYAALSLPSSHFARGRAQMLVNATYEMGPVIVFLNDHPGWKVFLEGHTDSIPINTPEFPSNYELSVARARAVQAYLVDEGVAADRCVVKGWADTRPLASNGSLEGRRLNRRVEVSFIPPDVPVTGDGRIPMGAATIRDFSELPDTFRVTVFWEMTSTSEVPADASLRLHVPRWFIDPVLNVRFDGKFLVPDTAGAYLLEGLARGRHLECTLNFGATEADTSRVGDIRGVLQFEGVPDLDVGPITVRPLHNGASRTGTARTDLFEWTESELLSDYQKRMNGAADAAVPDMDSLVVVGPEDPTRPGIVEPETGAIYHTRDRITISARIPVGGLSSITVDGDPVGEERIGRRIIDPASGMEVVTWYGVRIRRGWNEIALQARTVSGVAERDTIHVALSSQPRSIEAMQARYLIQANGYSREQVRFFLRDGWGLPVTDGVVATVVTGAHLVDQEDARPGEQGLQVLSRNGTLDLVTLPQRESGRTEVTVECQGMHSSVELAFVSPDKPVLATGIVNLGVGGYTTSGQGSGAGVEHFTDGADFQSEARLFVQGATVKGINLTARLDTKKRFDDPLLKDLDPERQYPMFGDASELRYAAPSQGGNYISLDRGESFVRYGDFRTPLIETEILTYQRATTGVNGSLINRGDRFTFFVAETDFVTHQDEMRADGTSGFYYLSQKPIVEYSEKIIVETRDRWQSEKVLNIRPMIRFQDYTINPWDGSILFKYPIPAYDDNFNPTFIVVIYELETRDNNSWLYGGRGSVVRGDKYRVGLTGVTDDRPSENYHLFGVDGEFQAAGFTVGGEVGRSEDPIAGEGNAYKLLAAYDHRVGSISGYHRRIDGTFNNPSFRAANSELATLKSGFKGQLRLSESLGFNAMGWVHQLHRTNELKNTARGNLVYRRQLYELQAGLRVATHDQPTSDRHSTLTSISARLGDERRLGVMGLWEKNVAGEWVEDFPDRLQAIGTFGLTDHSRLTASYEYLTAPGLPASHQLISGIEGNISRDTRAYTKYQMNGLATERRMGAVSGIQQNVRLNPHVTGSLGLEGLLSLEEREQEEYVAFKSGLNWRMPGSHFVEGQYENRWMRSRMRHMIRVNAAQQLDVGTGWVLRNVLSFANVTDAENELSYHGQVGGAYRLPGKPVQSLAMIRTDYERFTPVDPDAIRWHSVFSVDLNWTPAKAHETRLKYGFKHVEDYSYGVSTSTDADLVLGQYIYRFLRNWDIDLWARWLNQRHGGGAEAGAGIELGHLFFRAVRVAGGYSVNGFEDPDFVGTDAWSSGFGVRVQLILSEWLIPEFARINGE